MAISSPLQMTSFMHGAITRANGGLGCQCRHDLHVLLSDSIVISYLTFNDTLKVRYLVLNNMYRGTYARESHSVRVTQNKPRVTQPGEVRGVDVFLFSHMGLLGRG